MGELEKTIAPLPERVGVREFRGNFSHYMRQVQNGSSFLVTSRDEVVAIVHPPKRPPPPLRRPGTLRGRIRMMPDFDTLPPDLLAAMEADEE